LHLDTKELFLVQSSPFPTEGSLHTKAPQPRELS